MESETKFLFQIIIFRLGQQHRGNHTTTANWPLSNVRDQFRPALLRQTAPDSGEKLRWVGSGYTSTNIYALYECIYLYIFHAGLDISIFRVYIYIDVSTRMNQRYISLVYTYEILRL